MTSRTEIDLKLDAEAACRLCLRTREIRRLTRHRLVPGAYGGSYVADNVIPLCRPCHDLVDNRWLSAERRQARRMLRAVLWPSEIAHARRRRIWRTPRHPFGWVFDVEYPRPPRELVLEARARAA